MHYFAKNILLLGLIAIVCGESFAQVRDFFPLAETTKCPCLASKKKGGTLVLKYARRSQNLSSAEYFKFETNMGFFWPVNYLRREGNKIFIRSSGKDIVTDEFLLIDYGDEQGTTISFSERSKYILERISTDVTDTIYHFRRLNPEWSISEGCKSLAYAISKKRGFVFVKFDCRPGIYECKWKGYKE